jgi:hypothetical protein
MLVWNTGCLYFFDRMASLFDYIPQFEVSLDAQAELAGRERPCPDSRLLCGASGFGQFNRPAQKEERGWGY